MTTELIYPDFLGKSRHYTKRDIESGIPIVELKPSEVHTMEQWANEIMNQALSPGVLVDSLTNGAHLMDPGPCAEIGKYMAPEKDGA